MVFHTSRIAMVVNMFRIAMVSLVLCHAVQASKFGCEENQWDPTMNAIMVCDQEQCATQCMGNPTCVANCMAARDPEYPHCGIDCAAEAAGCGLSQCFRECLLGCNDRCVRCIEPNCSPQYAACLGVALGQQPDGCCEADITAWTLQNTHYLV